MRNLKFNEAKKENMNIDINISSTLYEKTDKKNNQGLSKWTEQDISNY